MSSKTQEPTAQVIDNEIKELSKEYNKLNKEYKKNERLNMKKAKRK